MWNSEQHSLRDGVQFRKPNPYIAESTNMNVVTKVCFAAIAVLTAITVAVTADERGQKNVPEKRLAEVEHVMKGIVHPHYLAIKEAASRDGVNGRTAPELLTKAVLLNEASFILVSGDRSRGDSWNMYAQQLREESSMLVDRLKAHDNLGVEINLKSMSNACTRCHAEYR